MFYDRTCPLPAMALTGAETYARLHEDIFEKKKNVGTLEPIDQETYSLIAIQAESKMRMGTFGFHRKSDKAASVLGLYIVVDGMAERLKKAGVASCAHEWLYWACAGYYLQMSKVAGDMFRDVVPRVALGLDVAQKKMAMSAWMAIFTDLAELVTEKRVTFMRMCVDSGVSTARAALRQIELAAEVSDYGATDMAAVQMDYATQLIKQRIKMEAMAEAAAEMKAEGKTPPPASSGT